jgi:hypothetical protein
MKAKFLKQTSLEQLRSSIRKNLDAYRAGDFNVIAADSSNWMTVDFDLDEAKLATLKNRQGDELYDLENCLISYNAFHGLTPYKARDERLWAYLTHTTLLEHTRSRWPIPENDNDAIAHILKHFFAKDKRAVERDNAISRLWWMAYLCSRVESMPLNKVLEVFLYMSDVRANIIERPTTSQSLTVFHALLNKLEESYKGQKKLFARDIFRPFMNELDKAGGSRLLECLEISQVEELLDKIIKDKLNLSVI